MEDIVLQAEKVMKHLMESSASTNTRFHGREKKLTTSQIRKFLTAVNTVTNKVNVYKTKHLGESLLSDELAAEVKYLKVKIIYQAGREGTVRAFVNEADLLKKNRFCW
jgi:CRISPR-associated protein Csm2